MRKRALLSLRLLLRIVLAVSLTVPFSSHALAQEKVLSKNPEYVCPVTLSAPLCPDEKSGCEIVAIGNKKNEVKYIPRIDSTKREVTPYPEKSLDAQKVFELINQHRQKIGLPIFQKDENLCQIAQSREPELYNEIFVTGNMHSGLYNRNLPFWVTENLKYGGTEEQTINWWLGSPIHRSAIEGNYTYSCGACFGATCVQLFTNYTPKPTIVTPPVPVQIIAAQ